MGPQKNRSASRGHSSKPYDEPNYQELEFTMSAKRQLSCAECRRLKRRCDRKWPCQSCIARGCASICPDGMLAPGLGSKFILHGSEQLHFKIRDMSDRISQLEDALTLSGGHDHPLLKSELLRVKLPPDTQNSFLQVDDMEDDKSPEIGGVLEEMGTLTLSPDGHVSYLGRTAKIEYLLNPTDEPDGTPEDDSPSSDPPTASIAAALSLPPAVVRLSNTCLITGPIDFTVTTDDIKRHLPTVDRGYELARFFFQFAGWFYRPMDEEEFMSRLFPNVYGLLDSEATRGRQRDPPTDSVPRHTPHELSLLCMVLAVGAAVDPDQARGREEKEKYRILSLASMRLGRSVEGGSIELVQTLNLLVYGCVQWGLQASGPETTWNLMGLATKISISLGLHRDSEKWKLGDRATDARRRTFWEIFSMESWQTLGYGRPPSFQIRHVDCKMPKDDHETFGLGGRVTARSYEKSRYLFVQECIWPIIDYTYHVSGTVNYGTIQELDKRVRGYEFPPIPKPSEERMIAGWYMQGHLNVCAKEYALMYIHRMCFGRALASNPDSPLDSIYELSVTTTFKSAIALSQHCQTAFQKHPEVVSRFFLTSTYLLQCSLPLSNVCTCGPSGPLTPKAFSQLTLILNLVQTMEKYSARVSQVVTNVQRLHQKAALAISNPSPTSALSPRKEEEDSDELAAYKGTARVVRIRQHTPPSSRTSASPPNQEGSLPAEGSQPLLYSQYNMPPQVTVASQSAMQNPVPFQPVMTFIPEDTDGWTYGTGYGFGQSASAASRPTGDAQQAQKSRVASIFATSESPPSSLPVYSQQTFPPTSGTWPPSFGFGFQSFPAGR